MGTVKIASVRGDTITFDDAAVDALQAQLRGELLRPADEGFKQARTVWNAMIDRKPGLIIKCAGTADVMRAVAFARDRMLLLSVRGGGHNIAGHAVCEGGLVLDLSQMRSVQVDPARQRAIVEPGATLADVDHETQAFGLATPLGVSSRIGVAGLTLGGGFGWLSRRYGLTVDNLVSADVVTAAGERLHADIENNADLFWAIRGGGGNFGVVTRFEYRLHRVGPCVLGGMIIFPLEQAAEVMDGYRRLTRDTPDDLSVWVMLHRAPAMPFIPKNVHGKQVVVLGLCYAGDDVDEGRTLVEAFRRLGVPHGERVRVLRYTAWQQVFDQQLAPGARNYGRTLNLDAISDGLVEVMLAYAVRMPSPQCHILLAQLGGAVNRVAADATAYANRDARYLINVHSRWFRARHDKRCMSWARELFATLAPHASAGRYVNLLTAEEAKRVAAAYGPNYKTLTKVKKTYDPDNLFRMNHNIWPA